MIIFSPILRSLYKHTLTSLFLVLSFVMLNPTPLSAESMTTEMGAIAFIKESNGRDAIFVKDASGENIIFSCASANVIILTPSVSGNGKYITFVVDNGRNQKTIHILGPIQKIKNRWQANDLELMTVRGGAWPVFKDDQSVYMSMPEQVSLSHDGTSFIYLISSEEIKQFSNNMGVSTHIWPLMHPDGDKLIYRYIPQTDEMGETTEPIKSVLTEIESGNTEMHFVDQYVYLEQWTRMGEILFSFRDKDQNGNRIYALYNPETRKTTEIYRNKSRQGALTRESRFLATIRPVPEGSPQFDIFVTDLNLKTEINLTQSSRLSESLIGWIQ